MANKTYKELPRSLRLQKNEPNTNDAEDRQIFTCDSSLTFTMVRNFFIIACLGIVCLFSKAVAGDPPILLPVPEGTYGVAMSNLEITDYSRINPYYPATPEPRRLAISAFYPVSLRQDCNVQRVPYMPALTASVTDVSFLTGFSDYVNGTFERFQLSLCAPKSPSCRIPWGRHHGSRSQDHPLVLFSTGLGLSRLTYSWMAQSLASSGYIVVTIDHPGDANIVEFSDGTAIYSNFSSDYDEQRMAIANGWRVEDIVFVLDQLESSNVTAKLFPSYTKRGHGPKLDTDHVGIFGHSFGGAAALSAAYADARFLGGADLDGWLFGPAVHSDKAIMNKPFILFGAESHNQTNFESWAIVWPRLTNWRLQLSLRGTAHLAFTDLTVLVELLDLRSAGGAISQAMDDFIGSINGFRAQQIIRTVTEGLFDFVLRGASGGSALKAAQQFSELVVANYTL